MSLMIYDLFENAFNSTKRGTSSLKQSGRLFPRGPPQKYCIESLHSLAYNFFSWSNPFLANSQKLDDKQFPKSPHRFSGESSVLAPQLNSPNIQIIPFQIHQIIPSANPSNLTNSSVSSWLFYSSDSQKSHNLPVLELFLSHTALAKNQVSEAPHLRWTKTRSLVKKWASTEYLNAGSACLAFTLLSRKKEILTDITCFIDIYG